MEPRVNDDGLRAAEAVFDRILDGLEERSSSPPLSDSGQDLPPASRVRLTQVRSAAARTLDLYADLFQRAFETYADLAQAALHPGTDPSPDVPLALLGRAGEEAQTTVWLHNVTAARVDGVELFMTDLNAASGARISAAFASFSPETVELEPSASTGSILRVQIPLGAAPGRYHGHVLSPALPASALAVCLVVAP
ncbi:hypothetical protein OJ997_04320 [Solirubrobacter phytolaccae]|uniref:Uncharacterized protein n=1 Tax=Solirubrobacter phytolaccae TaxID=1404360 RepID=A0A9X3S7R7_9ACTN|nr:hypothetical protein [Solirubrobacter phytolaccae]MDA0179511.1 hypothetical protein [Solirubrobacter phytolaccae]